MAENTVDPRIERLSVFVGDREVKVTIRTGKIEVRREAIISEFPEQYRGDM